jgi:hypothetical protein
MSLGIYVTSQLLGPGRPLPLGLAALLTLALLCSFSAPLHAQQLAQIEPLFFTKSFGGANPLPQTPTVANLPQVRRILANVPA